MEEWKEYRLGDVLNFRRGHDLPKTAMKEGDIPVAGSNGIIGYHNEATPISPCITIGRSGNVGTPYIYDRCWAHNTVLYIDDFKGNYPLYLFYLLKTLPLSSFGGGSAVPTLNRNHIHPLIIKHTTNIKTQQQVASILKSLDDKIEINHRINENLEQQAQALFKSWFVDFEPFRDQPFVESELGMIPEGWRVERIEDLALKMASGGTPKSLNQDYYSGDIRWFSTKELKDCYLYDSEKHISEDALNNSAAKMFPENTVLMAIYASPTVGRLGILTKDSTFNQAAVGIVPKKNIGKEFIYLSLLSERTNLNNLASGAAQQNLNVGIVKNYRIIVPPQSILDKFNNTIFEIFEGIRVRAEQIRTLSSLRDTLLPRLMSGELKVQEIEESL